MNIDRLESLLPVYDPFKINCLYQASHTVPSWTPKISGFTHSSKLDSQDIRLHTRFQAGLPKYQASHTVPSWTPKISGFTHGSKLDSQDIRLHTRFQAGLPRYQASHKVPSWTPKTSILT